MAPIIMHADVQRMLMTMRAETDAARAICLMTADALDRYHRLPDADARSAAHAEASVLTPVAKAFSTDAGIEVTSLGVQVHGGAGYIEETGAAQHYRDARIFAIYEGTNGIQAIDLVTRKLPLEGGAVVDALIDSYRQTADELKAQDSALFGHAGERLAEAVEALGRATAKVKDWLGEDTGKALAGQLPICACSPAPQVVPIWRARPSHPPGSSAKGTAIRVCTPASPLRVSSRRICARRPKGWRRSSWAGITALPVHLLC